MNSMISCYDCLRYSLSPSEMMPRFGILQPRGYTFKSVWYNWEKDCLVSHGTSRFINEKFFHHSDGYNQYRCSCGRPAIVNKQKGIYRCSYCKDNAEIYEIPTSWSSKLFMQELDSMGIGVKQMMEPLTYETQIE